MHDVAVALQVMLSSFWVASREAMSPHSAAAKAGSLGKGEGGLWRSVIAGEERARIAWRATDRIVPP
jgi:hypothetical protein